MTSIWQQSMIALARSQAAKAVAERMIGGSALARQYVGGEDAAGALETALNLKSQRGIAASLFYLGEYVDTAELAALNLAAKLEAVRLAGEAAIDVHVSVDPTQLGHVFDPAGAERGLYAIATAIKPAAGIRRGVHMLMLDMEDASVTEATIGFHAALSRAGLPVGLTLQAYRHRTEADMRQAIKAGAKVRLVKGAFTAGPALAIQKEPEIKANFRKLIGMMLSPEARASGFYPIIATHDTALHDHARREAARHGWQPGEYEFEMLLGLRTNVAAALAREGEAVRLYVPFGRDWWPYAVRRIGENPRNALLLVRSAVTVGARK